MNPQKLQICMDLNQDPIDTLSPSYLEPFTLETIGSLIQSHRKAGQCLILARIETLDQEQADSFSNGSMPIPRFQYYSAHHLNKILFRTGGPESEYIFRLYATDPLTKKDIVGNVIYFAVEPAGYNLVQNTESTLAEHQTMHPKAGSFSESNLASQRERLAKTMGMQYSSEFLMSIKVTQYSGPPSSKSASNLSSGPSRSGTATPGLTGTKAPALTVTKSRICSPLSSTGNLAPPSLVSNHSLFLKHKKLTSRSHKSSSKYLSQQENETGSVSASATTSRAASYTSIDQRQEMPSIHSIPSERNDCGSSLNSIVPSTPAESDLRGVQDSRLESQVPIIFSERPSSVLYDQSIQGSADVIPSASECPSSFPYSIGPRDSSDPRNQNLLHWEGHSSLGSFGNSSSVISNPSHMTPGSQGYSQPPSMQCMPVMPAESVVDWPTVTREDLFSVTGTIAAEESQNMLSQLPSLHSLEEEEPHETAGRSDQPDLGASFRYKLSGSISPSQEHCRALFVGTDDDFLQNEVMRELFALNALSPEESRLLEIPESVLRREGIILNSMGNETLFAQEAFEEEDEVEEEEEGAVCPGESISAWSSIAESSLVRSSPLACVSPSREEGLAYFVSPSMNLSRSASSSIRLSIHSDTDRLVVPQGEEEAEHKGRVDYYGAVQTQSVSLGQTSPSRSIHRFQTPFLILCLVGFVAISAVLVSVSRDGTSLGLSISLLVLSCILILVAAIGLVLQNSSSEEKQQVVEMQPLKKTVSIADRV